jgi:hypothetical protein
MRGLLRGLREIGRRTAVGRFLGDLGSQGNNVYTLRLALDNAALDSTGSGLSIPKSGGALHIHPQTFAGCVAEVAFGLSEPDAASWCPVTRAQVLTPPNGESFDGFWVRLRPESSVDATKSLVIVVDPAPYGAEALDAKPPTPEVDAFGAASFLAKIVRRSDGVVATQEGADGSVADRAYAIVAGLDPTNVGRALRVMANGALNVAGYDGAAQRELQVAAAALAATLAPAAGTLFAASFGYVYDTVGATWRRHVADVGSSDTGTPRMAPALTATSTRGQSTTAGAAAVQLLAANARRKSVAIKNLSTGDCYVTEGAVATTGSGWLLRQYESMTFSGVGAVSVIRATTDVTVCYAEESY